MCLCTSTCTSRESGCVSSDLPQKVVPPKRVLFPTQKLTYMYHELQETGTCTNPNIDGARQIFIIWQNVFQRCLYTKKKLWRQKVSHTVSKLSPIFIM
jgi:hypothetical protein